METISLPRQLPGDLDLNRINQQLRDRTAQLDWSLVEEVEDAHLATLVQGLNAEAITELGGDSLSEKLANRLLAILDIPPEKPRSSKLVQSPPQGKLFQEKLVPARPNNKSGQSELLNTEFIPTQSAEPEKENSVLASKVLSPNQIRDRLVTMIYKDLLGPTGGEFEEVDEPSLTERYLVGAIAPRKRSQKSTEVKEDDPAQQD